MLVQTLLRDNAMLKFAPSEKVIVKDIVSSEERIKSFYAVEVKAKTCNIHATSIDIESV